MQFDNSWSQAEWFQNGLAPSLHGRGPYIELSSDAIDPDDFSRWTFPKLFENRLPKYQQIADQYGVTIPSSAFHGVKNADDFLNVIRQHLPETLDDAVSVAS